MLWARVMPLFKKQYRLLHVVFDSNGLFTVFRDGGDGTIRIVLDITVV